MMKGMKIRKKKARLIESPRKVIRPFLVPELTQLMPFDVGTLCVPLVLIQMERALAVREAIEYIGLPCSDELFDLATSAKSAHKLDNYERLECLGDTFLKFLVASSLFLSKPMWHEGQLSALKNIIVSNIYLYRKSKERGIVNIVETEAFPERLRKWAPPFTKQQSVDPQNWKFAVAKKVVADVAEALIGAYWLTGGDELATRFCQWLQLLPENVELCLQPSKSLTYNIALQEHLAAAVKVGYKIRSHPLESFVKHDFKHKLLLTEAMTHASDTTSPTACFQRLEYIGDAVLDMVMIEKAYHDHPDWSPADLTECRQRMGNNAVLAYVAVKHGLHRHLRHASPTLMHEIEDFVTCIETLKPADLFGGDGAQQDEKRAIPPKTLSDIVEALFGATYIDGGRDAARVLFDTMMDDELIKHGTEFSKVSGVPWACKIGEAPLQLYNFVRRAGVGFTFSCPVITMALENHTCFILINNKEIARGTSTKKRHAKVFACAKALDRLGLLEASKESSIANTEGTFDEAKILNAFLEMASKRVAYGLSGTARDDAETKEVLKEVLRQEQLSASRVLGGSRREGHRSTEERNSCDPQSAVAAALAQLESDDGG
eukprot:Rmarinus@m.19819